MFQMSPCIMRCKPTQHDRWERRTIELAAYLFRHGHANVPEVSCFWRAALARSSSLCVWMLLHQQE